MAPSNNQIRRKMKTISTSTPSAAFLEYNAGKLEVRDGVVHLLPDGWAEYGPAFSGADLLLRDKMPLDEFRSAVRKAARATIKANDLALENELAKLETSTDDKRFIRSLIQGEPLSTGKTAQIIPFDQTRRKSAAVSGPRRAVTSAVA
jgi:hypothetical protein